MAVLNQAPTLQEGNEAIYNRIAARLGQSLLLASSNANDQGQAYRTLAGHTLAFIKGEVNEAHKLVVLLEKLYEGDVTYDEADETFRRITR